VKSRFSIRSSAAAWLLVLGAAGTAGCAYSIVSGGSIRPAAFESIWERTQRAYGIRLDAPVEPRVVGRRDLPALLRRAVLANASEAEFRRYEQSLVAVGLWPPDRPLFEAFVELGASEVAGLYVPSERAIYVVSDPRMPLSMRIASMLSRRDWMREFALAHELVHLLQHRVHPVLIDWIETPVGQDDAGYAVQAAIEGDAVRYGFAALGSSIALPDPEAFREGTESEAHRGAFARAPALIRVALLFAYTSGYRLSYFEGSELLAAPPASSEQVLHAERRREPFVAIDLGGLHALLPAGCDLVYENTMGELGISVLLGEPGDRDHGDASEGWDGDRYLVARCGRGLEFVWISLWDSESDALEFEQAYRERAGPLAARAGLDSVPELVRDGREVVASTAAVAPLVGSLAGGSRRTRVATLDELFAAVTAAAVPDRASGLP
jgi:hypothetical protein